MNEETIDDIVAEIRAYGAQPPPRLMWLEIADRIKSALDRDRTSRRSINIPIEIKPTSATLQALGAWISLAEWLIANAGKDALGQGIAKIVPLLRIRIDQSRAALSRPLRNCDVGTAEEQSVRFESFCKRKGDGFSASAYCAYECPCGNKGDCKLAWAQMPYTAEGGAE